MDYEKVVDKNRRTLEMLIGPFYHAGLNIWTTQEIQEDVDLEVRLVGKPMNLKITKDGEAFIAPVNEN